jgi:hypothetical protein
MSETGMTTISNFISTVAGLGVSAGLLLIRCLLKGVNVSTDAGAK